MVFWTMRQNPAVSCSSICLKLLNKVRWLLVIRLSLSYFKTNVTANSLPSGDLVVRNPVTRIFDHIDFDQVTRLFQ